MFRGEELVGAPQGVLQRIRGDRIGMIFREPITSLNFVHTIEKQIREVLLLHKGFSTSAARARVLEFQTWSAFATRNNARTAHLTNCPAASASAS